MCCPVGQKIENSSVEGVRSQAGREKRDAARKETCKIMMRNASGALTTDAKTRIECEPEKTTAEGRRDSNEEYRNVNDDTDTFTCSEKSRMA
jgi:hypothetical protein